MPLLAWLLRNACLFSHADDPLFARDAKGRAVWECRRCGAHILRTVGVVKTKRAKVKACVLQLRRKAG